MTVERSGGLNALAVLRQKLDEAAGLEVIHEGGYLWKAHFRFENPAQAEDIEAIKAQLGLPLPLAYEQFLLQCDGALLYYDREYGQWGFQLYGTKDLVVQNERWRKYYEDEWVSSYLAIAKSKGDSDVLVLDTAQVVDNGRDCRVLDGDSGYPVQEWEIAARSFSDWLDRLVVAQGAKYWQWY